ncbi:hypothetical protein CPB84DRAFT_1852021 [Gymnopilus junonius]|uniref:Uncharacterized protein n=1 Tax=Gymnopilus junonius TaxID=109634 RepID=A0A9P5NCQ3_GYMJU|nr:hypothetical protein CPB84DRAFT_1852021 [Gymnopilus junonius]
MQSSTTAPPSFLLHNTRSRLRQHPSLEPSFLHRFLPSLSGHGAAAARAQASFATTVFLPVPVFRRIININYDFERGGSGILLRAVVVSDISIACGGQTYRLEIHSSTEGAYVSAVLLAPDFRAQATASLFAGTRPLTQSDFGDALLISPPSPPPPLLYMQARLRWSPCGPVITFASSRFQYYGPRPEESVHAWIWMLPVKALMRSSVHLQRSGFRPRVVGSQLKVSQSQPT